MAAKWPWFWHRKSKTNRLKKKSTGKFMRVLFLFFLKHKSFHQFFWVARVEIFIFNIISANANQFVNFFAFWTKQSAYSSKTNAETYRKNYQNPAKQYQPDFDLPPEISGPKEDFLRLVGSMAAHGYNMIHKGITPSKGNFDDFCSILQKRYPKNKNIVSACTAI